MFVVNTFHIRDNLSIVIVFLKSPFNVNYGCVENKMCSGNERKEIKPSTNNKGDSQVNEEDKEIDVMPKDS